MKRRSRSFLLLPLTLCLACGCAGEEVSTVSGKATLDGNPYPGAELILVPAADDAGLGVATTRTDAEGNFTFLLGKDYLQELKPGPYVVVVHRYVDSQGKSVQIDSDPEEDTGLGDEGQAMAGEELMDDAPEQYRQKATSPLKVEIKKGPNEGLHLELHSG